MCSEHGGADYRSLHTRLGCRLNDHSYQYLYQQFILYEARLVTMWVFWCVSKRILEIESSIPDLWVWYGVLQVVSDLFLEEPWHNMSPGDGAGELTSSSLGFHFWHFVFCPYLQCTILGRTSCEAHKPLAGSGVHCPRYGPGVASLLVCFMHWMVNCNLLSIRTKSYIELANASAWYSLPLFFQSVKGSAPLHSGLRLFPITVL